MPFRRLLIVALVSLSGPASPVPGQGPQLPFADPTLAPFDSQLSMGNVETALEELMDRLRQAESKIAQLEAENRNGLADDADERAPAEQPAEKSVEKKWYEKYGLRGYTQFRWNEAVHRESDSAPPHHVGDASVSDHQNFLIRRARVILFGDVSDHMFIYFQPDFAVTPPGSPDAIHFAQIRDWYADVYCDTTKVYRFRVGQSKVPYGWENLQSSSNRLPLDRNDALNSAVRNERDLGVFFYWTPQYTQELFQYIMDEGLKGSGNYGVWGLGVYNGQGGSLMEQNDNLHVVSRFTYPYCLPDGQIIELGVQAYTGRYVVLSAPISPLGVGPTIRPLGTLEAGDRQGMRDERVAWSAIYYPQPWGFQSEWTVGRGPALNEAQTEVVERSLTGGYAMAMYRYKSRYHGEWWPFVRWNYYRGGYKSERNAPFSRIDELELGLEWLINKQMEFTAVFTVTDRTNTRAVNQADELSYRQFVGDLLRFQFQINY